MPIDLILPLSIVMGLIAYGLIARWYVMPVLLELPRAKALVPLLLLHCFRFIGLAFLIPGVTSQPWIQGSRTLQPMAICLRLCWRSWEFLRFVGGGAPRSLWYGSLTWKGPLTSSTPLRGVSATPRMGPSVQHFSSRPS